MNNRLEQLYAMKDTLQKTLKGSRDAYTSAVTRRRLMNVQAQINKIERKFY